jgi:hypothetical protein
MMMISVMLVLTVTELRAVAVLWRVWRKTRMLIMRDGRKAVVVVMRRIPRRGEEHRRLAAALGWGGVGS